MNSNGIHQHANDFIENVWSLHDSPVCVTACNVRAMMRWSIKFECDFFYFCSATRRTKRNQRKILITLGKMVIASRLWHARMRWSAHVLIWIGLTVCIVQLAVYTANEWEERGMHSSARCQYHGAWSIEVLIPNKSNATDSHSKLKRKCDATKPHKQNR